MHTARMSVIVIEWERERERRRQPIACMTESKLILYCNCITTEAGCYGEFPLVVVVAVFGSCCCSVRLTADQHTQFGSWKPLIDFVYRLYLLVIHMQYVFTYIFLVVFNLQSVLRITLKQISYKCFCSSLLLLLFCNKFLCDVDVNAITMKGLSQNI